MFESEKRDCAGDDDDDDDDDDNDYDDVEDDDCTRTLVSSLKERSVFPSVCAYLHVLFC